MLSPRLSVFPVVPTPKSIHHLPKVSDFDLPSTDPTPGCTPMVRVARLTPSPSRQGAVTTFSGAQPAVDFPALQRTRRIRTTRAWKSLPAGAGSRRQSHEKHENSHDNRSIDHGCWRLSHAVRRARQERTDGAFADSLILICSRVLFAFSKRSTSYGLQAWLSSRCTRTSSLSPLETVAKHFTQNESIVPSLFRRRQKCRSLGEEVATLAPYHSRNARRTRKTDSTSTRTSPSSSGAAQVLAHLSSEERSVIVNVEPRKSMNFRRWKSQSARETDSRHIPIHSPISE